MDGQLSEELSRSHPTRRGDLTSRPILFFVNSGVKPGDALQVFAFDDDYSFGVLQSKVHIEWFMSKRSNMKSDPRYSSTNVFGTFPWPQSPAAEQVKAVVEASRKLQSVRTTALKTAKGGLRALYDTLALPGKNPLRDGHDALDKAVMAAYRFDSQKDVVAQVLSLNATVATRIKAGQPVTGPGVPAVIADKLSMVSSECAVQSA